MDAKIYHDNKQERAAFYGSINYWSNALGELHHHGEYEVTEDELPALLARAYKDLFFDGDIGSLRYLVETPRGYGLALVNEYDECYADDCGLSMSALFDSAIQDAQRIAAHPVFEKAEIYLAELMGFDNSHILAVILPADISLEEFRTAATELDNLVYQSAKEFQKPTLAEQIQSASARSADRGPLFLGEFHIPSMLQVLAHNAWYGKEPTETHILAGENVIELNGYVYEPYYEQFSATGSISLNGRILFGMDSRTVESYRHETYQRGVCSSLEDALDVIKAETKGKPFVLPHTLEDPSKVKEPSFER